MEEETPATSTPRNTADLHRSGADKAAILLMMVGQENAAKVLSLLNPREIQRLGSVMTEIDNIGHDSVQYVLHEFFNELGEDALGIDPSKYARELMQDALGEGGGHMLDVRMLSDKVKGIEALKWMHHSTVAKLLYNEHPQVVAIILSYFDPEQAAMVLDNYQERFKSEVIYRIATLSTVQPQALFDLSDVLDNQGQEGKGGSLAAIGGTKQAAEILNLVGGGADQTILDEIAVEHEDISQAIQDQMFVFEDISGIDDRGIQTILGEVPPDVLIVALKGSDAAMGDKFLNNMSKRQAEILKDDLENSGPVKLSDVENAQRTIITTVRRLAEEGKVMMPGGGEEYV